MLQAATPDRSHAAAAGPRLPIRVLIVDDSVVARAVLSRLLGESGEVEIVGQVGSATAAMALLDQAQVDIILLDLEMPGLHGLSALPELIERSGGARVLIVSSACSEGASSTIAALRAGAADTLLKPSASAFTGRFASDLIDRLRRLAHPGAAPAPRVEMARPAAPPIRVPLSQSIDCLAIGASTGGVHSIARFFSALPADFRTPILITQHLPAPFSPYFAAQLTEMTGRRTRIAAPGLQPMPGELLLAPGDAHLTLVRTGKLVHVRLEHKRSQSGCLPSVDPMLSSIATLYGPGAVGVILSGMGRDGALGAAEIVRSGGTILAQDQESSVVWGMPGVVANAGLARIVAPPEELAARVAAAGEGAERWK